MRSDSVCNDRQLIKTIIVFVLSFILLALPACSSQSGSGSADVENSGYGEDNVTQEELKAAIEDAKKQTVSTLIDCKVLPKTMIHGYGDWWRVGVAQVSKSKKIQDCWKNLMEPNIAKARKY